MRPSGLDRWRVLVADTKYFSSVSKISGRFDRLNVVCPGEGENLRAVLSGGFDGLVAQSVPVDRDLLTRLTGLRVVLNMGRNYSNVDVDAVRSRGLIFASVPRKGPNCVAELALTLILALSIHYRTLSAR